MEDILGFRQKKKNDKAECDSSREDRGMHGIFSRMGKEGLLLADNSHLKNTADAS